MPKRHQGFVYSSLWATESQKQILDQIWRHRVVVKIWQEFKVTDLRPVRYGNGKLGLCDPRPHREKRVLWMKGSWCHFPLSDMHTTGGRLDYIMGCGGPVLFFLDKEL